jgi:peptidoglycan hydrolase-like protein with peptidoglycan-binding domain
MMKLRTIAILIPFFLAACGSMPQDRAISGGGIGAAGGAIIGAVTGLTVLQGALIGTGVGAVVGGLTSSDQFDLGTPFWRQSGNSGKSRAASATRGRSKEVADIQRDLTRLGYDPGPADGVLGPKTKAAMAKFESDQGHAPGQPIDKLAKDAEQVAATQDGRRN